MYMESNVPAGVERRGSNDPIPPDVDRLLSLGQRFALNQIRGFGWRLAFVRAAHTDTLIFVVVSPDSERYAVLEVDGEVNMHPDIVIRH